MITFENVTKQYSDGTTAVDDLNMHVDKGSFTVFVGPSGCGKTTSMRMINRMTDLTSGLLTVDGADVRTVDPVKLRLGIGYVIQNAGLMPHQRVIDNVATVPVLRGEFGAPRGKPRSKCWSVWGSIRSWRPGIPRSSPEANNSVSGWRVHWPPTRRSC